MAKNSISITPEETKRLAEHGFVWEYSNGITDEVHPAFIESVYWTAREGLVVNYKRPPAKLIRTWAEVRSIEWTSDEETFYTLVHCDSIRDAR